MLIRLYLDIDDLQGKSMTTLADLMPDPDEVLELEPEELAGIGLELLMSTEITSPSRLHPTSFSHPSTIRNYPDFQRAQVERVLMEVWSWLVQEGIIAPLSDCNGWHFITRRGQKLRNREGLNAYRNTVILPRRLLHPLIAQICSSAFLRGDHDTAVFQAFKELEIRIRDTSGSTQDDYGVVLARKAFHPQTGTLTDKAAPEGEKDALMHLVAGAIGSYKNPHSHRKIKVSAEDAVEMIILASHLYKIVDDRAETS